DRLRRSTLPTERAFTPVFDGLWGRVKAPSVRLALPAPLDLRLARGRAFGALRRAIEVAQEFAEDGEVIRLRLGLAADRAQHVVQTVHQRFLLAVICRSLKRESSRTKSSKRRVAAASSRSANSNSPLDDAAHRNSARCARSPRSENVRIRSGMIASLRTMNAPRARCPLPSPLWGGSTRKARRGGGRSADAGAEGVWVFWGGAATNPPPPPPPPPEMGGGSPPESPRRLVQTH